MERALRHVGDGDDEGGKDSDGVVLLVGWGEEGGGGGFMRATASIRTVHRARMCRPRVCAGDGARGGQSIDQGRDYGGAMEDLWER